jgi:DNA gyrase/topoisomerase IV subunit B
LYRRGERPFAPTLFISILWYNPIMNKIIPVICILLAALFIFPSLTKCKDHERRGLFVSVIQEPWVLSNRNDIEKLIDYAKKEKLNFQPQDCFVGFRAITMLSLYTPEYTSQTKEKLSTSKLKLDHIYIGLDVKLNKLFEENLELKNQLLMFFESYRKSLSTSKNIIKGGKEVSRYNQIIDSKLKDCTSHNVEQSELFIVEGSSAAGGLVQCRNTKYHAILGLKGKIPNLAAGKKDFLKNKEVIEICNAL